MVLIHLRLTVGPSQEVFVRTLRVHRAEFPRCLTAEARAPTFCTGEVADVQVSFSPRRFWVCHLAVFGSPKKKRGRQLRASILLPIRCFLGTVPLFLSFCDPQASLRKSCVPAWTDGPLPVENRDSGFSEAQDLHEPRK